MNILTKVCFRLSRPQLFISGTRSLNLIRPYAQANKLVRPLDSNVSRLSVIKKVHENGSHISYFHTTPPKYVPPILLFFIRPLSRFAAVILGRSIRKWYRNLPPDKKAYFKLWLKRNYMKLILTASLFTGLGFVFYESHINETPITKRKRFTLFTEEQYSKISKFALENSLAQLRQHLLSTSDPMCQRVERVATRLIYSNMDIDEIRKRKWTILVVNDPKLINAFVTPSGEIFVFTGMVRLCNTDDQLGTVLAHEISHAILGHAAEILSNASFIDLIVMVFFAAIWALLPSDFLATIGHFIFSKLVDITFSLPYTRKLEVEADEVGLTLSAKACFDVRTSVAFWRKMHLIECMQFGLPTDDQSTEFLSKIDFLSTHPSSEKRAANMEEKLAEAIKLRELCQCPKLPTLDPRVTLEMEKKAFDKKREEMEREKIILIKVPRK